MRDIKEQSIAQDLELAAARGQWKWVEQAYATALVFAASGQPPEGDDSDEAAFCACQDVLDDLLRTAQPRLRDWLDRQLQNVDDQPSFADWLSGEWSTDETAEELFPEAWAVCKSALETALNRKLPQLQRNEMVVFVR